VDPRVGKAGSLRDLKKPPLRGKVHELGAEFVDDARVEPSCGLRVHGAVSTDIPVTSQAVDAGKPIAIPGTVRAMSCDPIRAVVARNLKLLMDSAKVRQQKLAERSGVSQSSISAILRQEQAASVDTLSAIAQALGVPAWLLTWPDLPTADAEVVTTLLRLWQGSAPEGREYILATAKREHARAH
jgi:transcriptional regulator with XRE-family HTH domain